ncbi:MAG: aromatic/alkene/methane monooxygenase hydroxylase/oxygenase subunit alpha [Fulvimonas sp.]|nr:aromatic/alkene/methane monooxygenase hydroxylase/oxygenase subunit alpha [Fulvimonas sp.]
MTNKRMSLREKYTRLTRDLAWEPSYQPRSRIHPQTAFEGIHIHDWDQWEDPFRLTVDAYWKYQAEKERKLYAIIDAFAQNNGQLNVSDARYINALKIFLTAVTPLEYEAHRGFARVGRQFAGPGPQVACQMQAIDELRHAQTEIHTLSQYNKYFHGFHDWTHMFERVWYLSVPKSWIDDVHSSGPFEFVAAISFSFEYVLTNLLFMPFMSGAAYNGDMATVTFGFSAQSDESRHMTLGLEVIKFMLEQDERNVPVVQRWLDKWFWRSYRLLSLVSMMMDYMLPKRVMSWKEAWEIYFEQNGGALFEDLSRYGIRTPKYAEVAVKEKDHVSHQLWSTFYGVGFATAFHTWIPEPEELDWLSSKYPQTFDRYYRPRWEFWKNYRAEHGRWFSAGLPMLCQVCQIPLVFTEPDDPTRLCHRSSQYEGDRYHFCSDGCKDIFDQEPEKYVQAWLPVHQIFQGHCGGAEISQVLEWYRIVDGVDNKDYADSPDRINWLRWKGRADADAATSDALTPQ